MLQKGSSLPAKKLVSVALRRLAVEERVAAAAVAPHLRRT
jgi:hypothetical protein